MKTALIHLGMPKTATTSFQNAIFAHRATLLSRHRILYPSAGANHTNFLCPMFLPDPRTHISVRLSGIETIEDARALSRSYSAQLEKEISSTDWDRLIFSAEGLSNLSAKSLGQLREWVGGFADRIEVIYWLRHPVPFTVSVIQQLLKGGETIDEMLAKMLPLTNYRRRVENAIAAFGKDMVRVYRFEDAISHPGGPVAAFCEQVGIPDEAAQDIIASASVENESMSNLAAYTLDALNRAHPLFVDGALNPDRHPSDVQQILRIKGLRFDLPAATKKKIREISRPEIAWLTENFGREFYPDVLDPDFSDRGMDAPSEEETRSLALVMWDLLRKSG